MIKLSQIRKLYDTQEALRNVDLQIEDGECVVLIGPSGCGKSSLLKSINRMIDIDAGTITFFNEDILSLPVEQLRRKIGYCIQGVGLFPHMNVKENIAILLRILKWKEVDIDRRVDELLLMSELPLSYKTKKPHELSGGEAQRVGVCRALATDPPVLLMDEPFGALDPMTREKIQIAFRDIQQKLHKTVVFVTHDIEEAILLGDRIALMNEGQIVQLSTPEALIQDQKETFTKNFIGQDYPLMVLKRYRVRDLKLEPVSNLSVTHGIDMDTNLKEALALCIKQTEPVIFKDGQNCYALLYSDIFSFIRGMQDENTH